MGAAPRQGPTYLARRSYRQRRLRDAARMLPVLGVVLWLLPLAATRPHMGLTGLYIFGVWMILILLSAMLARRLDHTADVKPETVSEP